MGSTSTHRFSFFSLSLAISFLAIAAADDVVLRTCKIAVARDPDNVRLDFCVRSLAAALASESADLFKLGAISIQLIRRNASDTRKYIERLLKEEKASPDDSSFLKPRLRDCRELYSDAGETLRDAAAEYASKRYVEANVKLSSVMDAVTTCEDGFKEIDGGGVSPLTKRNSDAFQLTAITLCIVTMRP